MKDVQQVHQCNFYFRDEEFQIATELFNCMKMQKLECNTHFTTIPKNMTWASFNFSLNYYD